MFLSRYLGFSASFALCRSFHLLCATDPAISSTFYHLFPHPTPNRISVNRIIFHRLRISALARTACTYCGAREEPPLLGRFIELVQSSWTVENSRAEMARKSEALLRGVIPAAMPYVISRRIRSDRLRTIRRGPRLCRSSLH